MAKRKQHSPQFKAKVALEAIKDVEPASVLAARYSVHPTMISRWKNQLLEHAPDAFSSKRERSEAEAAALQAELYEQIGRLKMELEWLKKKLTGSVEAKRALVEPAHPELSIRRQCELLGLCRSSFYYEPATETQENLILMRMIDAQYLKTPFYGSRKMTRYLCKEGYRVNRKRVQRLMRLMGIEAIYPKPQTSQAHVQHTIYPYLLRGVSITDTGQVWSSDITYVPVHRGFLYLVAVIDWFSRYVLSWRLSNTLDSTFCIEALEEALSRGRPEIFNTDQGCQFTSNAFTSVLDRAGVRISMDGRGRALDNVFIERLWRSVKYEDVYLRDYADGHELSEGLASYFRFYNHERYHQSLDYRTPAQVHYGLL